MNYTAEQIIKACIAKTWLDAFDEGFSDIESLIECYDEKRGEMTDEENDFRCRFDQETTVTPEYSRHYDSVSVAAFVNVCDFSGWIGWTYWSGGGKFGEPESMPWIENAYFLSVTATKTIEVNEFEKAGGE